MRADKIFEKYGQSAKMTIESGAAAVHNFRAFVQPLRYKNKLYLRGVYTEIGKNKEDYYLYIGPPAYDVSLVDGLSTHLYIGGNEYLVYRTEKHMIKDENVYYWAIIRPVVQEKESGGDTGGDPVG